MNQWGMQRITESNGLGRPVRMRVGSPAPTRFESVAILFFYRTGNRLPSAARDG